MSERKVNPTETYGHLTVHKYNTEKCYWQCVCKCGNIVYRSAYALRNQKYPSCGCMRNTKSTLPNRLSLKRSIYRYYKANAKKKKLDFNLTEEEFYILITKTNCSYCEAPPSNLAKTRDRPGRKKQKSFKYQGIDRVNPKKGYTVENCVPCCKICNISKNNLSLSDWKEWIYNVYQGTFND